MSKTDRFKKGQIVPKRLRLAITSNPKAQHCITFGADVEVSGRTVRLLSDGAAIVISAKLSRPRKNGTRQKCHFYSEGFVFLPKDFDAEPVKL